MNTQLDVVFWGGEHSTYELAFQKIVQELEEIELTISRYNSNSELFKVNQLGFPSGISVGDRLMRAAILAAACYEKTNGYFDISLGTAFHELKNGRNYVFAKNDGFFHRVILDVANQTLKFLKPDVSLDFGGMGKGMALKAIGAIIDGHCIKNAFISFGGSSILTRGTHPHGDYWPFSLADYPEQVWKLNNDCLSISSAHRKVSDNSINHILNPFNSQSVIPNKTAVVQSQNPIDAEVLSTALIAAPEEEHSNILANFSAVNAIIL